jgi:hypothetical protein
VYDFHVFFSQHAPRKDDCVRHYRTGRMLSSFLHLLNLEQLGLQVLPLPEGAQATAHHDPSPPGLYRTRVHYDPSPPGLYTEHMYTMNPRHQACTEHMYTMTPRHQACTEHMYTMTHRHQAWTEYMYTMTYRHQAFTEPCAPWPLTSRLGCLDD